MTYLIKLQQYIAFWPFQAILLITIIVLTFAIKHLFFWKNSSRDYKIYNFTLNTLYISAYIIVFLMILSYVRYLRWGFTLELIPFLQSCLSFFQQNNILFSIIILQILFYSIIILIKLKNILRREIWKRHLYYFHTLKADKKNGDPNPFYVRLVLNLGQHKSYDSIISNIVLDTIMKPFIYDGRRLKIVWLYDLSVKVLKSIPEIFFIIILFYEIIYNNFCIHFLFYYLPFYFIYALWRNTSRGLNKTWDMYNTVIYERYYRENDVIYFNTTIEEDNIFLKYIENGFVPPLSSLNLEDDLIFYANFIENFIRQHRFVRAPHYINPYTGDVYDITNGYTVEEIYK